MSSGRIEAHAVLSADGKLLAESAAPAAARTWLRRLREGCRAVARPRTLRAGALGPALRRAAGGRVLLRAAPGVLLGAVESGLLDRLHVVMLPVVAGGARTPTLLGPVPGALLRRSVRLRLVMFRPVRGAALASYAVGRRRNSPSVRRGRPLQPHA